MFTTEARPLSRSISMVDLGFEKICAKNCMKMKEIGPRRGGGLSRVPSAPWIRQWFLAKNCQIVGRHSLL